MFRKCSTGCQGSLQCSHVQYVQHIPIHWKTDWKFTAEMSDFTFQTSYEVIFHDIIVSDSTQTNTQSSSISLCSRAEITLKLPSDGEGALVSACMHNHCSEEAQFPSDPFPFQLLPVAARPMGK